jgi:hypothetical protein
MSECLHDMGQATFTYDDQVEREQQPESPAII